MRTLSSDTLAALARGELVLRALVELQLLEETYGFWNDIGNVTIDGVEYIGTGTLASISVLPATTSLSIPNYTLVLSGLDSNVLATFFEYTWHQKPVKVYLACFDPGTGNLVDDPTLVASGRLDKAEVKGADGQQAALEISCEDISRRLTWTNPAVRSHGDQLRRLSTDTFFQYVATTSQQLMWWGRAQPTPPTAVLSTGGVPVAVK